MIRKLLAVTVALLMLLALVAGCSGNDAGTSNSPGASQDGNGGSTDPVVAGDGGTSGGDKNTTIVYGTTESYGNGWNPSSSVEGNSFISKMIYNYLITVNDYTGELYSPISDDYGWYDNVTLYFKLKDNITFSDGSKMTGEDVLNTIWTINQSGNSHASTFNCIDFDASNVSDDGMTVYIVFLYEYGPALSLLQSVPVQSKAFCDAHPDGDETWWSSPLGSGPYILSDYAMDSYFTVTLREDYWDDEEFEATQVTVRYYSDSTTLLVDYQNGVVDCALNITADQVEAVQSGSVEGTVVVQSANDVPILCVNETSPALQDIAVRQAIAYGCNWDEIADIAWGSLGIPATSHYGVNYSAYVKREGYAYDPELAKRTLTDAGYAAGEVKLLFVTMGTTQQQRVAEAVQGYMATVGVDIEVASYDTSTVLGMYMNNETDLSMFSLTGVGASLDCHNMYGAIYDRGAFACMMIMDPTFNGYVHTGLETTNQTVRDEAYKAADEWLYENCYAIPICERQEAYVYSSRLSEVSLYSIMSSNLGHVSFAG